jgi:hypothetical protein
MTDGICHPKRMATVTSREIAELLAGSDDPERRRQKLARVNNWQRAGWLRTLGCDALNPGVGRGGVLEFPAAAKAWCAVLDEMADSGAGGTEIFFLLTSAERLKGGIERAMRGEQDLALIWNPTKTDGRLTDAQPQVVPVPVTMPEGWTSGRWIHLTAVFGRARD